MLRTVLIIVSVGMMVTMCKLCHARNKIFQSLITWEEKVKCPKDQNSHTVEIAYER